LPHSDVYELKLEDKFFWTKKILPHTKCLYGATDQDKELFLAGIKYFTENPEFLCSVSITGDGTNKNPLPLKLNDYLEINLNADNSTKKTKSILLEV
jgi:hypothetical protein